MSYLNLDSSKRYLLACSYGPDSMALFHLLLEDGMDFEVAIVNYHLRNESTSEVEGLQNFCNKKGKILHIFDVKNPPKKNIEKECRDIRYSFFKNILHDRNLDSVLVAHHADDHIETYLLQKQRKIRPIWFGLNRNSEVLGIKIIRPLLQYFKADLLEICLQNSIPFAIDSSNLEDHYLRNVVRHSKVEKMTLNQKHQAIEEIDNENKKLTYIFDKLESMNLSSVDKVLELSDVEFAYAMNKVLSFSQLGKEHCQEVRKILNSKKPNIQTKIKNGVYLIKTYDSFRFVHSLINEEYTLTIKQPSLIDNEKFYMNFSNGNTRKIKDEDYPITVRTALPNDIYVIKNYEVKVRRLFIDWKMPLDVRKKWLVICDKNGKVIYVPRYQKKFTPSKEIDFFIKL